MRPGRRGTERVGQAYPLPPTQRHGRSTHPPGSEEAAQAVQLQKFCFQRTKATYVQICRVHRRILGSNHRGKHTLRERKRGRR